MNRKLELGDVDYDNLQDLRIIKLTENKLKTQRRLSICSLLMIFLVISALILLPVPIDKIKALETIITTTIFALASIVGAFLGFSTWMTNKTEENHKDIYGSAN